MNKQRVILVGEPRREAMKALLERMDSDIVKVVVVGKLEENPIEVERGIKIRNFRSKESTPINRSQRRKKDRVKKKKNESKTKRRTRRGR